MSGGHYGGGAGGRDDEVDRMETDLNAVLVFILWGWGGTARGFSVVKWQWGRLRGSFSHEGACCAKMRPRVPPSEPVWKCWAWWACTCNPSAVEAEAGKS